MPRPYPKMRLSGRVPDPPICTFSLSLQSSLQTPRQPKADVAPPRPRQIPPSISGIRLDQRIEPRTAAYDSGIAAVQCFPVVAQVVGITIVQRLPVLPPPTAAPLPNIAA